MKFATTISLSLISSASGFVGPLTPRERSTSLCASRRDALLNVVRGSGILIGMVMAPKDVNAGTANPFFEKEINFEPSQMAKNDKIDINGAFVVSLLCYVHFSVQASLFTCYSTYIFLTQTDYKQLPGFYPHAAGKIAL